jgi:hypothetical protein
MGMAEYDHLLMAAVEEIDRWQQTDSPEARWFSRDHIERIKSLLEQARGCSTLEELSLALRTINHILIDSGPMDSDFAPSLSRLTDGLYRLEKRNRRR